MKQEPKKTVSSITPASVIFWRTVLLMSIFGVLMFLPLAKDLFDLQVSRHDELQSRATRQQTRDVSVSASRGSVYDTNGKTLAVSATVYNVILSPKDVNTVEDSVMKEKYGKSYKSEMTDAQIASAQTEIIKERIDLISEQLSELLDADADDIRERCGKTESMYSLVQKKVESDVANQVRAFAERYGLSSCIYLTDDSKRYYPYSDMAAQLIGFVNSDNTGVFGLEAMYEDELSGSEGRIVTAKNNMGMDLSYYYSDHYDAKNGDSVTLTIDSTIQYYCEQTLQEGIEKYNVLNGGWCIAMDPNTGAVLGMASSPTYDPNSPSEITDEVLLKKLEDTKTELDKQVADHEITQEEADAQYEQAVGDARVSQWTNLTVNATYEPGSTFKSIVLAAALEENKVDVNSTFYCSGVETVDGWNIRCSARSGHGSLTLAEAVGKSCNIAFMDMGRSLGGETMENYFEAFGLFEKTGIDLAGESSPIWWGEGGLTGSTGEVNLLVSSFGQRFKVTPIQLITAVSATINGGYLYEPHVLQSVSDSDGNVVETYEPTVVRQVVSEDTSETVRELLEGVVEKYTAKNAYQPGYRIGGKTGSAQTNTAGRTVVSFVGFAPANDPKVIVLLAFDNPEPVDSESSLGTCGVVISGGQMACPLAGELIAEICDYMGVPRQYKGDETVIADATMPSVVGMSAEDAKAALESAGLNCRTEGDGDTVTGQLPVSGVTLSGGSSAVLYLGGEPAGETVAMPDLSGMSGYQAKAALAEVGLFYRATGLVSDDNAVSDGQSVTAGTEVTLGTVITVHFSNRSVEDVQ